MGALGCAATNCDTCSSISSREVLRSASSVTAGMEACRPTIALGAYMRASVKMQRAMPLTSPGSDEHSDAETLTGSADGVPCEVISA